MKNKKAFKFMQEVSKLQVCGRVFRPGQGFFTSSTRLTSKNTASPPPAM